MKRAGALSNNDLMAACRESGKGGGWEAEAIEHWRWQMRNGEAKERVLAWVKLHSVARGSPKCVDEAGRSLHIESCAADLRLALHTVQNHCTTLVAEGRIRLKKAQLWYRADVPEKIPAEVSAGEDEESRVLGNFAAYQIDFYRNQPAEKRTKLLSAMRVCVAFRAEALAEGLAVMRHEISRIETNMFRSFGAPKIVLPKRAAQKPRWFQPMLLDEPSFVQGNLDNVDSASVQAESPAVQTGPSLLGFRPDQTLAAASPAHPKKGTSSSSSLPAAQPRDDDETYREVKNWMQLFSERNGLNLGEPDRQIVRRVVKAMNGASLEELAQLLRRLHAKGHKPRSSYGWLATVVEEEFRGLSGNANSTTA